MDRPYTHTGGKFTNDLYDNGNDGDGDGDDSDDDDADDGRKWIRIAPPHTHTGEKFTSNLSAHFTGRGGALGVERVACQPMVGSASAESVQTDFPGKFPCPP